MTRTDAPPRAATFTLPTSAHPSLDVGCARCRCEVRLALTVDGVEQGRRFLLQHTVCLS